MCQLSPPSLDWTYSTYEQNLHNEYCGNVYNCEIDWSAKTSLKNLISQLDMYCAPVWQIAGIGFMCLIGIVVGCLTLTKLGDFYGRRPIFMLGYAMNFSCIIALMFSNNKYLMFVFIFGLGMSIAARYYVGYTYNVEMCPKAQQVWVSTFQFCMESLVSLLICVYFGYISDNWIPL